MQASSAARRCLAFQSKGRRHAARGRVHPARAAREQRTDAQPVWLRSAAAALASAAVTLTTAALGCVGTRSNNLHDRTLTRAPRSASAVTLPPLDARPEVAAVQRELAESWLLARENFVAPDKLDAAGWDEQLPDALARAGAAPSAREARAVTAQLLATLDDPYTRILQPSDFSTFKLQNDGQLSGVGLLLAESEEGRLMVVRPLADSPAFRAGVEPGDEILSIDGLAVPRNASMEDAAVRLRGKSGSSVQLRVRHSDTVPGTAHRPPFNVVRNVRLAREVISLSPVSARALPYVTPDGVLHKCSYLRLSSFSSNAPHDVDAALARLRAAGAADGVVLDLRGNPGGLVSAGLEVARTFLSAGDTIVSTLDRSGTQSVISLVASGNGSAPAQPPLVVLIDRNSASASEIVAGALRDNGRALLLGERTYGKGKIQSVYELFDGAALFLTVATYHTPSGASIDRIGIGPDVLCAAPADNDAPLVEDPCVIEAEARLARLHA